MSTILLSIKPEYANKIMNGTKKYEFRKRLPKDTIHKIIIYSSSPEKRIIGEVEVIGTVSMKMTPLWKITKNNAGIGWEQYREYFKGCSIASAYILGKVSKYKKARRLVDYGIAHAPQSFVYFERV